ncbi:N-formylglutamate amidohydrolase [Hyphobacterium sp.]|uniref:N-formylglutamate amidohydrolase n=1 Tax=Hyphobacterium sp. TaxID=2004662 RepID=UPI003BAA1449
MTRKTAHKPLPMDTHPAVIARIETPVHVRRPESRRSPLVLASPHSGRTYPPDLISQTVIPLELLRRSEDAYVDILISGASEIGLTTVTAAFPRVFIDPNRSTRELDPALFADFTSPDGAMTAHVQAGLGIIPRISANGRDLYPDPLPLAEGRRRIADFYRPYHGALDIELKAARDIHGLAILLDFHSMPAAAAAGADIVLGDRYGEACAPEIINEVEHRFEQAGLRVRRNRPYAGGYTTSFYGKPAQHRHALQIEINRGLYLDEDRVTRSGTFDQLKSVLEGVLQQLADADWASSNQ